MNTATDRASAILVSESWRPILPLPHGVVASLDWPVLVYLYGGFEHSHVARPKLRRMQNVYRAAPLTWFTATAGGSTIAKTIFPGSGNSCDVPLLASNQIAPIVNGSNAVIGAVYAPARQVPALLLMLAAEADADVTVTIEFGALTAQGSIATTFASLATKTITTNGTITNINPWTGEADAGKTWRLFDLCTITGQQNYDQLFAYDGGTENNLPSILQMDCSQWPYYYALVTDLSTATDVMVCYSEASFAIIPPTS